MNRRAFAALAGLAIVTRGMAARGGGSPEVPAPASDADQRIWRISNKCGQNCVYMILKLLGKSARYDDVERRLPVKGKGTTLAALRDCARSFGLEPRIVRGSPEALCRADLPLIAHWDEENSDIGHYVVVIAADPRGVRYIDGTTTSIAWLAMPEFQRRWTGYLVTFGGAPWWRPLAPAAMVLGGLSLVLTFWNRRGSDPHLVPSRADGTTTALSEEAPWTA